MSATGAYHVSRILGTLELLARAPRSSTQIADALQIHVRTARRFLARLVLDGYVHKSAGPRPIYSLTPRFSALAIRALHQQASAAESTGEHPEALCVVLAVDPPPSRARIS
jgi:DNA-binding IclR family transcriptional regulator